MTKTTIGDIKFVAKRVLIAIGALLLCLPLAFVLTFLLLPVWSWIEATYGIESVGHSGPSDWCFWLIYSLLALIVVTALVVTRPRAA